MIVFVEPNYIIEYPALDAIQVLGTRRARYRLGGK